MCQILRFETIGKKLTNDRNSKNFQPCSDFFVFSDFLTLWNTRLEYHVPLAIVSLGTTRVCVAISPLEAPK